MTNQNIFATTNCSKCSFSGNCPGQRGLMSSMERRDCVPAYMALSDREVKNCDYTKGSDSKKKGRKKRNRSRSKKRT